MGFINAAAIIIGLSQLPMLLGIPAAQSKHFLLDITQVLLHINTTHLSLLGFWRICHHFVNCLQEICAEVAWCADNGSLLNMDQL